MECYKKQVFVGERRGFRGMVQSGRKGKWSGNRE
jgi:hypothetical protein